MGILPTDDVAEIRSLLQLAADLNVPEVAIDGRELDAARRRIVLAGLLNVLDEPTANTLLGEAEKLGLAMSGLTQIRREQLEAVFETLAGVLEEQAGISAGGVLSTGNSRSGAVTAAADTRVRRGKNQLSAVAAANYSRSGAPGAPVETTVENYQGTIRYDRFLTEKFAIFMAISALGTESKLIEIVYTLAVAQQYESL